MRWTLERMAAEMGHLAKLVKDSLLNDAALVQASRHLLKVNHGSCPEGKKKKRKRNEKKKRKKKKIGSAI